MKSLRLLLIITAATSVAGCDKIPFLGGGGSDPAEVARLYWAAMAQQDPETAGQHAFVSEQPGTFALQPNDNLTLTNLVVADATVGGDRAVSHTTMHASGDGVDADLDFSTTIVRIDGDWKVDQNETLGAMAESVLGPELGAAMNDLGDAMGDAVEGMAEGLSQGMAEAAAQMASEQPRTPPPVRRTPVQSNMDEFPWDPEFVGTIDPGMTREQVVAIWGEPLEERHMGNRSYMYFRNGCERRCGIFDLVLLEGGQVIDAVVRGPGHIYSGVSSSPPDRLPEETLPAGLDLP